MIMEEKLKDVEGVCNPIVSKAYQASGGAPGGESPSTEEEDHDEL